MSTFSSEPIQPANDDPDDLDASNASNEKNDGVVAAKPRVWPLFVLKHLPGINLLDEQVRRDREIVFGVCNSTHNMTPGNPDGALQYMWCVQGDWKLIVRYPGSDTTQYKVLQQWDTLPAHLFNLKDDPHERNDQANAHPKIVAQLKTKIEAWHRVQPYPLNLKQAYDHITSKHLPAGPYRGYKTDAWDCGFRVPFLVRWPGKIEAGGTHDGLLCLTDMLATFAALGHEQRPTWAGEDSFNQLPML